MTTTSSTERLNPEHTTWRCAMTIRLDHTIVPATDKVASAAFFVDIFGLTVKPGPAHFAQVQVNESLTLDFADAPEPWGGPGFDPRTGQSHHYAFHVSEAEFETIFGRVQAKGSPTAADHSTTPTASSTPAGAGGASTSRTSTATCWKS
jgi:catechol 2,3-dioxygenase-like lactoylglutathione lyase family enzyme